jgi:hypothetical protein
MGRDSSAAERCPHLPLELIFDIMPCLLPEKPRTLLWPWHDSTKALVSFTRLYPGKRCQKKKKKATFLSGATRVASRSGSALNPLKYRAKLRCFNVSLVCTYDGSKNRDHPAFR